MSFRCLLCNKKQQDGTKPVRVTLETRPKTYEFREKANKGPNNEEGEKTYLPDPGGKGTEIAKECNACSGCAKYEKEAREFMARQLESGTPIKRALAKANGSEDRRRAFFKVVQGGKLQKS